MRAADMDAYTTRARRLVLRNTVVVLVALQNTPCGMSDARDGDARVCDDAGLCNCDGGGVGVAAWFRGIVGCDSGDVAMLKRDRDAPAWTKAAATRVRRCTSTTAHTAVLR